MSRLAVTGLVVGGAMLAAGCPVLFGGAGIRRAIERFPRSRAAGCVLALADVVWVTLMVLNTNLGGFERYKPLVYLLAPAWYFGMLWLMDELLAPRALGGLLLLGACPMMHAARFHESAWKYLITLLAYGMVIKGMILVLSPYKFRKWMARFTGNATLLRLFGASGCVLGALLIVLSLTVY